MRDAANGFFAASGDNGSSPPAATGPLARARAFCAARPDREHEIVFNRLGMCVIGLSVLAATRAFGFLPWTKTAYWLDAFLVTYSVGIFLWLIRWPGTSAVRRVAGIAGDHFAIVAPMYFGGQNCACMFPLLLWAIFGNGFRFGIPYLFAATLFSVCSFTVLILTSGFWMSNASLSIGLLLGLIVLPAYTSVLIRQLSEAKRLAEEANRAKTLFLASVSHELRTPLNAIIGLSDLLTSTRLDEEQIDMSLIIGRSGRSLLSLINSILDISRMECGFPSAKVNEANLYSFVGEIRDMLAVQARAKDISLGLHIDLDTPRIVLLNTQHVEEILVNLVGNAIKFTTRGHVLIHVGATRADGLPALLRIEVTDTGIGIAPEAQERIFDRFSQADESIIDRFGGTGLGLAIAKQLAEGMGGKIGVESVSGAGSTFWLELPCEIVTRAEAQAPAQAEAIEVFALSQDSSLADIIAGAGGAVRCFGDIAAFCEALAGAAGARARPIGILDARHNDLSALQLSDEVRRRTAGLELSLVGILDAGETTRRRDLEPMLLTTLSSPIDASAIARALAMAGARLNQRAPANAAPESGGFIALKVLVAEDNRTNQLVIRKILERAGHSATVVADGQQALEKLSGETFDLALMDINMPVLNGLDATKLYQYSGAAETRAPIVALTADATPETERKCLEAGMIACITKPIEPSQLSAWLQTFAHERAAVRNTGRAAPGPAAAEAEDAGPIDSNALDDLKSLGGEDFVSEIVDQFLADAANVLRGLHEAVADGDVQRFRDEAHALRSCAANVGALRVYKLCLDTRAIDARELAIEGELRIRRLEMEFERARDALACFVRSDGAC